MEDWELDFEWLAVRHRVKEQLKHENLPDLNAILMLIGVQELGKWRRFSKEEKQDLMHIGACRLLSQEGFFAFEMRDTEGWPHYTPIKPFPIKGEKEQERYLKIQAIQYFKNYDNL